jgi:hypothetical protein
MAAPPGEGRPVPAPEAFERSGPDARLAQAALLLAAGAGVAGATQSVETDEQFPLPPMPPLRRAERMSVREAAASLSVDTEAYARGEIPVLPPGEAARAARRLYEDPTPEHAAALVEAGLHHRDRLVRTAAAVSALDTTGPREDVVAILERSVHARDADTREIARIGLARVAPQHPAFADMVVEPRRGARRRRPSRTAAITHGTFAARTRWWQPGGDFYQYLDTLTPSLHLHSRSFQWSGMYSTAARDLAAEQLTNWVVTEQLQRPDLFGHSHGVTVINLATRRGLRLDRLVMLAWPVHDEWLPDLSNVQRVISHRVRMDLVILADRGGQRLPQAFRASPKVAEHVVGWFRHSLPHEPDHWRNNRLDASL